MKTVIIILAALLVLRHPLAVGLVLAVEAAVCGGIGWLTFRGLHAVMVPPAWRRAAA